MAEKKQTTKVEKVKKKNEVKVTSSGRVYITATFNNTLVTITNATGDVVGWSSSGASGFKGTRKSTPFAATTAMEGVAKKAVEKGMKTVDVFVKGPGPGREASLRGIRSAGLSISMISDLTPIPHNGPRSKKRRRV